MKCIHSQQSIHWSSSFWSFWRKKRGLYSNSAGLCKNKILLTSFVSPVRLLFWWCKDEMKWKGHRQVFSLYLSYFSPLLVSFILSYLSITQKENPSKNEWHDKAAWLHQMWILNSEYCPFAHLKNLLSTLLFESKIS